MSIQYKPIPEIEHDYDLYARTLKNASTKDLIIVTEKTIYEILQFLDAKMAEQGEP
jgi:hypothetical protein